MVYMLGTLKASCSLMLCDWLIHRTRHDLAQVVALLKTQIDPELLAKELAKDANVADGEEKNDGGKFWNSDIVPFRNVYI